MSDEDREDLYFDAISTGVLAEISTDKIAADDKESLVSCDNISTNHAQEGESGDTFSTNGDFRGSCDSISANQWQAGVSGDIISANNAADQSAVTHGQDIETIGSETLTDKLISDLVQQLEDKIHTQTVTEDHSGHLTSPAHAEVAAELTCVPEQQIKGVFDGGDIQRVKKHKATNDNTMESVPAIDCACGPAGNIEGVTAQQSVPSNTNPGANWKLNDELKTVLMSRSNTESLPEGNSTVDVQNVHEHCNVGDTENVDQQSGLDETKELTSLNAEQSGFVVVEPLKQTISAPLPHVGKAVSESDLTSISKLKEGGTQCRAPATANVKSKTWRSESKKKSETLKRQKNGNPFTGHGGLHSFKDGELPEIDDTHGLMHIMNPFDLPSDDSDESFSDSTFDSCTSDISSEGEGDDNTSISDKPLPAKPAKQGLKQRINARLAHSPERAEEEEESMILPVQPKRYRSPPRLPPAPDNRTREQQKLEGVLKSLSESEISFINSLERLTKEYQDPIINTYGIRRSEVRTAFKKIAEILNIHKMFQIELGEKLKNWYSDEKIGSIFNHFSLRMVLDMYSDYVNSYGAASEQIKEAELAKPNFREFLRNKQMLSTDRLSLAGLMLKPIQRFPQFIMIIKDLLKYTPRDHHDREPLQEGLTGIENVAHQLNERKRQSEQYYHGEIILNKLSKPTHGVANTGKCFLIRQDDVNQLSQDIAGSHNVKYRRLFLMNDKLISVHVSLREQDGPSAERFTFKWSQSLHDLELRMSSIAPHMHTKISGDSGNVSIQTPVLDKTDEDPYSIASDLNDMMHDISVLGQISQLVATLKLSYTGLTEDAIQQHSVNLQKQIQGKDYQLQMLNSSSVILWDSVRNKKYIFGMLTPQAKQEWCIDFLLAKSALDVSNIPGWHCQDIDLAADMGMPTYLIKHMSLDMQRHFTRVQCAVPVYFPTSNEGSVEHLWVCTSKESHGQVSIISLHTAKPGLVESFQATACEIVCAEVAPGFALVTSDTAFEDDSVWMSTVDSEILVFVLSEKQNNKQSVSHRKPIHTFRPGCLVVTMTYIDDAMICGNRNGSVIIYSRDDDGVWSRGTLVILGVGTVTSIIPVGNSAWVACGQYIYIVDPEQQNIKDKFHSQHDEAGVHAQYLVKAGVGVWVSFEGHPNICLYHTESRKLLQNFNITSAINEFISVYSGSKETSKDYTVTSLMASLGLLWVGTNVGIILAYPLPRLRDGVPRIKQRPHVALHGHNQSVKFLIPVHYGPISGTPIRRRPSSILGTSNSKKSPVIDLEPVVERPPHEGHREERIYETIEYGKNAPSKNEYEKLSKVQPVQSDYNSLESCLRNSIAEGGGHVAKGGGHVPEVDHVGSSRSSASSVTSEHNYFILDNIETGNSHNIQENIDNNGNKTDSSNTNTSVEGNASSSKQAETLVKTITSETSEVQSKSDAVESPEPGQTGVKVEGQSESIVHGKTRAKAMTFRSELARKLQQRKSTEDLADHESEVERLYEDLMNTESKRNCSTSKTLGHDYRRHENDNRGDRYFRPRAENPIFARKPSTSLYEDFKLYTTPHSSVRHASFKNDPPPMKTDARRVSSSFTAGSTVDTLRKRDSNTMLVLSGGDGYQDWKKRQNVAYRPDEACLLFWMYKF